MATSSNPSASKDDGGDPGGRGGQGPVAVQLPGMPGHAQGRRSCPSRPCPRPGRRRRRPGRHPGPSPAGPHRRSGGPGQGGPDRVVGDHRGLLAGAAGGGGDQPLLHGQELGGGPAALLQRPIGHHGHRPLGQNRSARSSSSARLAPTSWPPRAAMTSWRAKVDAVAVSPSGQASRSNTAATVRSDRSWSRSRVRPVTCRTRVSGSCPARPPPSATVHTRCPRSPALWACGWHGRPT